MSLPWFAFHIDPYLGDTLTLDAEGHGAYLLLMLHYYRTGTPPPDNDRALANICRMSVERWLELRPLLAVFFDVSRGDVWRHVRIESEMRDASERHAARIAQRSAASAARWGKNPGRKPKPIRPASVPDSETEKPSEPKPSRNAARIRTASDPVSGDDPHKQRTDREEGEVTLATLADVEDSLPPSPPDLGMPVDLWQPQGVDPADLDHLNRFVAEHIEAGTFSRDWPTLWQTYLAKAKAPPPQRKRASRVEVNKRPEPAPGVSRSMISQDAYTLADNVLAAAGITEGMKGSYGVPMLMQAWLAQWPAELILSTVQNVMASRTSRGEGPPDSVKYFENAVARAYAELQRPLPNVTVQPAKEITTHAAPRRRRGQSVSDAAANLAAKFAALTESRTDHGALESAVVGGAIPPE